MSDGSDRASGTGPHWPALSDTLRCSWYSPPLLALSTVVWRCSPSPPGLPGGVWRCLTLSGGVWRCLALSGGIWPCLAVSGVISCGVALSDALRYRPLGPRRTSVAPGDQAAQPSGSSDVPQTFSCHTHTFDCQSARRGHRSPRGRSRSHLGSP